jgi:outer membrane protein OmpA-like peptidoglycan-associated protein
MRQLVFLAVAILSVSGAAFAQSANARGTSDQQAGTPPYTPATTAQNQEIQQNLKDVHFAFDRYDLSDQDRQTLIANANWLKANPEVYITIGGDADERGGIVYNLVLSQERAMVTHDALVELGVPADRIVFATGWGKLYPVCEQSDESCWSENRRAHLDPWQAGSLAASNATGAESESTVSASAVSRHSESSADNAAPLR